MANEKNLIPNNKRTPSERRENAKKAGKASGEARRAQKTLREYADALLLMPVSDTRTWNKLARMGIAPEEIDNKMLMLVGLFKSACAGDVSAEKEMRNIIGEDKPLQDAALEKLDEVLLQLGEVMQHD